MVRIVILVSSVLVNSSVFAGSFCAFVSLYEVIILWYVQEYNKTNRLHLAFKK